MDFLEIKSDFNKSKIRSGTLGKRCARSARILYIRGSYEFNKTEGLPPKEYHQRCLSKDLQLNCTHKYGQASQHRDRTYQCVIHFY
jgi:hypothetical protein